MPLPMILGVAAVTALLARARASKSIISHDGVQPMDYSDGNKPFSFIKTNQAPSPLQGGGGGQVYQYPQPANQLPYDPTPPIPADMQPVVHDPSLEPGMQAPPPTPGTTTLPPIPGGGGGLPGGDPSVWQPGSEPVTHEAAVIDAAVKENAANQASQAAAVKENAAKQAAALATTADQKAKADAAAAKAKIEKTAADKAAALAKAAKDKAAKDKAAADAKAKAKASTATVKPAPTPAPAPIPGGVDLVLAKSLAPKIESDIIKNKFNYSRAVLTQFQIAAGLAGDGIYGGYTAGALTYFLGHTAPKPLFAPTTIKPYVPPGDKSAHGSAQTNTSKPVVNTATTVKPLDASTNSGFNETLAKKLAPQVESNIIAKKSNYDRTLLKNFQTAAGIAADGIYGGGSAGALRYYLGHAPPKPLFKPTTEAPYTKPGTTATAAKQTTATNTSTTTVTKPVGLAPAEAAKQLRDYLIATGDFGDKAHPSSKVKELQGPLGTTADGIVGPNTRTAAAKYGVTLPVKGAVTTQPSTADLMKQPPSTLLALRSVEAPKASTVAGAAAAADLVPSMTAKQAQTLLDKITAWGKASIGLTQQVMLYNKMLQLAKDKNKSLTLPLTWTQLSEVIDHPAAACALLTQTLGQATVNKLFVQEPTLKARWALYCSSQVTKPDGFPDNIWAIADDAQRRQIIMNWLPGVEVVQPAKTAAKTTTATVVKPAGTAPAGYNPAEAKRLAPLVVKDVAARSYDYNRGTVRNFQTAAGIPADGILGGGTANALTYYGAKNAKALFKPSMSDPAAAYHPPA